MTHNGKGARREHADTPESHPELDANPYRSAVATATENDIDAVAALAAECETLLRTLKRRQVSQALLQAPALLPFSLQAACFLRFVNPLLSVSRTRQVTYAD